MAKSRICLIPNCGKPVKTRGWCKAHYSRWWQYGDPQAERKWGQAQRFIQDVLLPMQTDECVKWPFSTDTHGRPRLSVHNRSVVGTRYLCALVHGNPPTAKHQAAHSCGQGAASCCNPKHLYWATRVENEADKLVHGTSNRGARNGQALLNERQVREIKALLASGQTQPSIAAKYGVSRSTVLSIKTGKNWAWVE
jgi:hypothetical protein